MARSVRPAAYARALKDYDAYLREIGRRGYQNDAYALFGRGIARRRLGDFAGSEVDLKAARSQDKDVERAFAEMGLKP